MKDYIQERTVDLEFAVVFNKPQLAEAIHKEADPRAGCAHHLRQYFLRYFGNHRFRYTFLAKVSEQ
jgi:hypothetical protein